MSFILDALKKSETDRQQQSSAEFAAVPTSPAKPRTPRWLLIVGVLLAINLAVLIGLLLRPEGSPPLAANPTVDAVSSSQLTPTATLPSFEQRVATAQLNPPEQQTRETDADVQAPAAAIVKPVLISQDPAAIPAADLYPSIHEVRASGNSNLPELHLDIHVFNSEPADRFVFINMAKLREGSQLEEGPFVAEITLQGVLLRHQGQLFLLPRD